MTFKNLVCAGLILVPLLGLGQQRLTELDYLAAVEAQSPALKASRLTVEQSQTRQGTALSLPDAVVNLESPTGEFYATGVYQAFRLPGFYQKQRNLLRSETGQTQAQATLSRVDMLVRARQLFLEAQYYQSLDSLLAFQDSLYRSISSAAERLYQAGQTDALQSGFAATQAIEVSVARRANQALVASSLTRLATLGGLQVVGLRLPSLFALSARAASPLPSSESAPVVQVARQSLEVARRQTELERSRFKPSFGLGYFNQGYRETPASLRVRAVVDIPIWTRQYRSAITASRVGQRIAEQNLAAQRQAFRLDSILLTGQRERLAQSLADYERILNPRSDEIIRNSTRLKQVGQQDVISHLRTVNDAFSIKLRYLDLVRQWREAQISTNALGGTITP